MAQEIEHAFWEHFRIHSKPMTITTNCNRRHTEERDRGPGVEIFLESRGVPGGGRVSALGVCGRRGMRNLKYILIKRWFFLRRRCESVPVCW